MSQAIITAVVSSIIAGIFAIIGNILEAQLKTAPALATGTTFPQSGGDHMLDSLNIGKILIHIGIIQLVANIIGAVIGMIALGIYRNYDAFIIYTLIFGTIAIIVCFAWSGTTVRKAIRWKHLSYVAIGVIVVTLLLSSIILQQPISALWIVVACLQTFGAMGIGGAIANATKQD